MAIVGATVAVLSSPGGHTTAGTGGVEKGKKLASPAATPAVTSDGLAKTVLRFPSGLKGQVGRWKAGAGGAALSAVTQQLGTAAQSAGLRRYPLMRRACVRLDASVKAARAAPPIPDVAMQKLYGKALAELSEAAAECQQAISEKQEGDEDIAVHTNMTLLDRSRLGFAVGSRKLYEATAAIGALRSG